MKSSEPVTLPFDKHAGNAIQRLRSTLCAVIGTMPEHVSRASDLQHALGIDKMLSWRIYSVVQATDPYAAALHVPGVNALGTFLRAAERRGVPTDLTNEASVALAEYERFVRVHAGDRRALEMLLAAHSDEARAETALAHRRMSFRGNSYTWGASARVQLRLSFVKLGAGDMVDIATIFGLVDLQRIRPNMSWTIGRATIVSGTDSPVESPAIEPFYDLQDPDEEAVRVFLGKPVPAIRRVRKAGGQYMYVLQPGPVGKTGAVTCLSGEVVRQAAPRWRSNDDRWGGYVSRVRTPVEVLIHDIFIHAHLYGRLEPELAVRATFGDVPRGPRPGDEGELHVLEQIRYAGRADGVLHAPDVPRYAEMVRFVFNRLGWNAAEFDVYQLRMEYPIMPSDVSIRVPLPPPPEKPSG